MNNPDPNPRSHASIAGLSRVRYVATIAVAGLSATTLATFAIAIAKTAKLLNALLNGKWRDELIVVSVLEAVDIYLLAIVQIIVVVGLFELFIGDLDLPAWLEARSLEDLKKPIVDVLVVFMSVKGIERFITAESPEDALTSVGAVAVFILSLTAFRALTATAKSSSSSPTG